LSAESRNAAWIEADLAPPGLGDVAARVGRVLIVDDDQGVRDLCRYTLQSDGIRCDEATDGAAALYLTKTRPYDLVLSDIDMPKMTGPELLHELRSKPPCPH